MTCEQELHVYNDTWEPTQCSGVWASVTWAQKHRRATVSSSNWSTTQNNCIWRHVSEQTVYRVHRREPAAHNSTWVNPTHFLMEYIKFTVKIFTKIIHLHKHTVKFPTQIIYLTIKISKMFIRACNNDYMIPKLFQLWFYSFWFFN